jgi:hypothetical protein
MIISHHLSIAFYLGIICYKDNWMSDVDVLVKKELNSI